MDDLLEEINNFYHQNGHYPKVKVARPFYAAHFWQIHYHLKLVEIDETVDQWELE